MKTLLKIMIVTFLPFLLLGSETLTLESGITAYAGETLDELEASHLAFMREEEKLARDVYITLGRKYPQTDTFRNINESEQRHTDAVAGLLHKYEQPDPNTKDKVGKYTGEQWGWYFTEKYGELVKAGKKSLLDALYVGAFIEELDMNDIIHCPVVMQQELGLDESQPCGLTYTDKPAIQKVYTNLVEGSENHLRAYVYAIERIIGEGKYEAQYLTQEQVDEILGR